MSNLIHLDFHPINSAVIELYATAPDLNYSKIISLLRAAAHAGFRQQAENLRDELYSFEQGQPL